MTKFIQQKFQETYYWHHQIHESNQRDFYGTQKPFSFSPSNAPRKMKGKSFFSRKPDRKNSIIVTNSNSNNVIPTTGRQAVSNRDMLRITALQQTFLSMDLSPGKPMQWESRKAQQ